MTIAEHEITSAQRNSATSAASWSTALTIVRACGAHQPDDMRLSDLEPRFVCKACGKRGGDARPDFNWNKKQVSVMGYR
jgi:hypothetical protein